MSSNEVRAAKINAFAVIVAALITGIGGTWLGSILESNKGQMTLNQTFYEIIEEDENSDITLEEIKQKYLQLQSDYDSVEKQNEDLANEKESETDKLTEANEKISELQTQSSQEIEDLKNQLNSMPSVQLKDIALSIDGENIPINSSNSLAVINNRTYYSEEILKNLISPNTNMAIQDNTMYIGRIIKESSYLLDEWVVDSGNVSTVNNITDSLGGTHINALLFSNHGKIIYNLKNEYSLIKFKLALDSGTYLDFEGILTIKADDRIVYESPILTKTDASHDEADIPIYNCSLLTIEFNYTYSWGKCIMSDIVIYN